MRYIVACYSVSEGFDIMVLDEISVLGIVNHYFDFTRTGGKSLDVGISTIAELEDYWSNGGSLFSRDDGTMLAISDMDGNMLFNTED